MTDNRTIDELNHTKEKVKYPLSCGHAVIYEPPPTVGDTVYCRICDDYHVVMKSKRRPGPQVKREKKNVGRTRVECNDCKFVRTYPTQKEAKTRAQSHAIRLNHTVIVIPPVAGAKVITLTSQGP